MSAPAAARSLFRIPPTAFRQIETGEDGACQYGSNFEGDETRVQNIARILRQTGYTVARLSARTRLDYGSGSRYFIPPTFLYKLRSGVTPHICQIAALSEITGYRFVGWMRMFGFDLQQIPRLQMRVHPERTVLVTPIEFESQSFRSYSSSIHHAVCGSSVRTGSGTRSHAIGELHSLGGRYWFVKIGNRDALVSPRLIPGAIVRIDRCYRQPAHLVNENPVQQLLWLVEQPAGLTCCHVRWIDDHQVVLLPSRPPWGNLPLCLPTEARVLGLVEPGFGKVETWRSRAGPTKFEPPRSHSSLRSEMGFSNVLRAGRCRSGLTFRAAHHLTRVVAQILASQDYAIGLGLLSDYEATGRLPRHIAKIIALCIVYCLDIRQLIAAAGVYIDDSNKMPLPAFDPFAASNPDLLDSSEHYRTVALGEGHVRTPGERFERISQI